MTSFTELFSAKPPPVADHLHDGLGRLKIQSARCDKDHMNDSKGQPRNCWMPHRYGSLLVTIVISLKRPINGEP